MKHNAEKCILNRKSASKVDNRTKRLLSWLSDISLLVRIGLYFIICLQDFVKQLVH